MKRHRVCTLLLILVTYKEIGAVSQGDGRILVEEEAQTRYLGGRSTPFKAMIRIALADRIPIGVVIGQTNGLCNEEKLFKFDHLSTREALKQIAVSSGYLMKESEMGVNLVSSDLSPEIRAVLSYRLDRFRASPHAMSSLGQWLSGYIAASVEGARGFAVDSISSTTDEILPSISLENKTALEIANYIIGEKSKGMWIMSGIQAPSNPGRHSTVVQMYSYHDSEHDLKELSCAPFVTAR